MSDRDQFKPQPAVDISPNWPPLAAQPVDDPVDALLADEPPRPAFVTPAGDTITECAVCLVDAAHDDAAEARRPWRAVTAVAGTPVCRQHLRHLDRSNIGHYVGHGIVETAARFAAEVDR